MKHFDFKFLRVWMVLWCAGVLLPAAGQGSAGSADVLRLIEKVNDYWQAKQFAQDTRFLGQRRLLHRKHGSLQADWEGCLL